MLWYILLLAMVCPSVLCDDRYIKLESSFGTLQGSTEIAPNGQNYSAFYSIPYALPPVGDLRFRDPIPSLPVEGTYSATMFKPYCVQLNLLEEDWFDVGVEDCLYLSVFTPPGAAKSKKSLKKVLVFYHGGGNMNGFPDLYHPGTLVTEHDLIVVVPAYRLGYFGFLSTGTPGASGNYGLKDQLLALSWVKENIQSFGGDPDDITISGESAGGQDVSLLALTPKSKDLFKKAHLQSGAIGPKLFSIDANPAPAAIKTGRQLGCLEEESQPESEAELEKLADCLRQLPVEKFPTQNYFTDFTPLGPYIDGDFFPRSIAELFNDEEYLQSINFFDRNYMVGVNENEGCIFELINKMALDKMTEEQREATTPEMMLQGTVQQFMLMIFGPVSQTVLDKVYEYYNSNYKISPVADFTADAIFYIPSIHWVEAAAKFRPPEDSGVYFFLFVHSPNWVTISGDVYRGTVHGLDLTYEFDINLMFMNRILNLRADQKKWTEEDDRLKKKYCTLIADFVKTGNPSRSLANELPSGWPSYNNEGKQYLQFGLEPVLKDHFLTEKVELWSDIIPEWIREYPLEPKSKDEL